MGVNTAKCTSKSKVFFFYLGVNESVSDVIVSFHNITWKKEEINGILRYDPSINLLCSFTPSADDTLLYHIDWYVDNDIVIRGQTVDKTSLQDAILSAEDLNNNNKKINSWVCEKFPSFKRRDFTSMTIF